MGDFEVNFISQVKTIYLRSKKPISQIFTRIRGGMDVVPYQIGHYDGRDDDYRYYKLDVRNKPGNMVKVFKELKRLAPEIEIATKKWRLN